MRITLSLAPTLAAMLSLNACSTAQPDPTPSPAPAPAPITQPPVPAPQQPSGEWTDWPISLGTWVYRKDSRGSIALFGPANADATVTVRCDQSPRRIYISRVGQPRSGAGNMTLRASSGLQSYNARSTGGPKPYTAITVDPGDIMLDRIAFSRGRFAIETDGMINAAVPVYSEFARVVEDCRS